MLYISYLRAYGHLHIADPARAVSSGSELNNQNCPGFSRCWFCPFAGIVLYFLYATIRFQRPRRAGRIAWPKRPRQSLSASGDAPDASKYGPASSFATAINGFGVTQGNWAELLDSPDEQRARDDRDFDGATRFINVFYYIWVDDETGRAVARGADAGGEAQRKGACGR